ncbi:transposable element Tcb1 transposase [Trichonephila clavipes]|uniref:Transposable element Tcb1 transposase n=1 Tax=Trichonephila clavipes TaxID=2585209 RepID=A0A8X6W8M2_TRICX|nr:transposable element Tcb1 transposase [Trichonephila clavipes]
MDWPAYSPDLNPIEHVWDMLGRRIAARQPPPTCLPELRRELLDEWCNIPQDQNNNLILSMPRRCHLSKSCPNHSRGPRCLSCNLYGHKSFECRRANLNNISTPPSGVYAVHELPSPINMCKDVTIFGRKLNGLVDTQAAI